ncbi:hypothetical protein DSO57_1036094 [Entomophthora muscae]|uniref:Uncharacterized protein n=1 Tax=Entomophthora muscae TaxID=34485 RepID=A0ACC2UK21_9FUNG|nr:hypothetical protein DSO57_1036094 [Entomophthora muscae]
MAYLGLLAPLLDPLASVMTKVAVGALVAPALHAGPRGSFFQFLSENHLRHNNLPYLLQLHNPWCQDAQTGLLIWPPAPQTIVICLFHPHCLSFNNAAYHFTLTGLASGKISYTQSVDITTRSREGDRGSIEGWLERRRGDWQARAQKAQDNQLACLGIVQPTVWEALPTVFPKEKTPPFDFEWPGIREACVLGAPEIKNRHKVGRPYYLETVNCNSACPIACKF